MKSNIEIFNKHICFLEECSINTSDNGSKLVKSELEVANFDSVKEEYVASLSLSAAPCSVDAVLSINDTSFVFIEFKAGNLSGKQYDIRKKIYDSVLILCDIIKQTISYTRNYLEVAFVYDEEENPRLALKKAVIGLGDEDFDFLDLRRFEKYCVSKILYIDCKEFGSYEQKFK